MLIALGAVALCGSAVAIGAAIRHPRKMAEENGHGDGTPGVSQ